MAATVRPKWDMLGKVSAADRALLGSLLCSRLMESHFCSAGLRRFQRSGVQPQLPALLIPRDGRNNLAEPLEIESGGLATFNDCLLNIGCQEGKP